MIKKRESKPKEPESIACYFRVESFEAGHSYSVRNPRDLSNREVNRSYGGKRPEERLTFASLDLDLAATLLEPRLDHVSQAKIELASVERKPASARIAKLAEIQ